MATPSPRTATAHQEPEEILASARRTIDTERTGLEALRTALEDGLADPFKEAVATISRAGGRVIVSGMGKPGHIGRKIAATLASTGTPAFFVHPAEASHGDLGMVTEDDVVLVMSWSGETRELGSLIEYTRRWSIPLIAMTATSDSSVGREADIVLALPRAKEACPHGLAPTTSSLMLLALGDALAIALLENRGFTPEKYHGFHPGGRLGADLHYVSKIMHIGPSLPLADTGTAMTEALVRMTEKGFGCLGIVDSSEKLIGMITDGDLRRHLGPNLLSLTVSEIMTRDPKTIEPDTLVGAALDLVNQAKITALFVVENGRPVGLIHMHDLLRIGVA